MKNNLEIEKKYLIKYPDIGYLKSVCDYTEIEQIYLKSSDGVSERIRRRGRDGVFAYYHTVKTHITAMTRTEEEREITCDEYEQLRERADKNLNVIYKTRYCMEYKGHIMEIDVFPFWTRQAYLEIELSSEDESFKIPEFIQIIRDVTEERIYTNRSLAYSIPEE